MLEVANVYRVYIALAIVLKHSSNSCGTKASHYELLLNGQKCVCVRVLCACVCVGLDQD